MRIVTLAVVALALAACAASTPTPTATLVPVPTLQAVPTWTPEPTWTPVPAPTFMPTATPSPSCDPTAPYDTVTEATAVRDGEETHQQVMARFDRGDFHQEFSVDGEPDGEQLQIDGKVYFKQGDDRWREGYGSQAGFLGPCGPIQHTSGYFARGEAWYALLEEEQLDGETVRVLESIEPLDEIRQKATIYVGYDDQIRRIVTDYELDGYSARAVETFSGYGEPNVLPGEPSQLRPTPTPSEYPTRKVTLVPPPPEPTSTPSPPTPTPLPTFGECDCDGRVPIEEMYDSTIEYLMDRHSPRYTKVEVTLLSAEWGSDEGMWETAAYACTDEGGLYESTTRGTWDADCNIQSRGSSSSRISETCDLQ